MEQIPIRSIQHYLYCKHRWGLMEIDCAWAENAFVTRANIMHERVHSPDAFTNRGKQCFTDVYVWNDDWGIYGKLDCLEKTQKGYTIVEYKPTKPQHCDIREEDAFQLFAQKLCADAVLKTSCLTEIYYGDVRKRFKISDIEQRCSDYANKLHIVLDEMRSCIKAGRIPPVDSSQNCSSCSMKDLCMPLLKKKRTKCVRREIESTLRNDK